MVFVIDAKRHPLDMCHESTARKLLKQGKAAIFRMYPFTIILKREVPEAELPGTNYRIKIDYGSRHTGLAILKGENVVWLGQIEHRTDIKAKMDKRRGYRRRRRNTNLRCRALRFSNRTRPKGWLPPSLMSRVQNIETWVRRLSALCPIGFISYENVKFDTRKMQDPNISSIEYQQGTLLGYEIRGYLSEKFGHKCCYCGVSEGNSVKFEVEHIIPKSRGGSNRISNLAWSCRDCNAAKANQTAEEFGHPEVQEQVEAPLRDAAMVTATRWKVYEVLNLFGLPVECGTGGKTAYNRKRLGISKDHCYDAACVGASTPEVLHIKAQDVFVIEATGRGQHCRTNVNASGFPRGYLKRQKQFFGFQTGDIAKAVVPSGKNAGTYVGRVSCRARGSFNIRGTSERVNDINHKYFSLIHHSDGYSYSRKEKTPFLPTAEVVGFLA